ncbi:hypothetical protein K469DRAFT_707018 [Zopfia rhizophila CBS 207.26]|uniref:Uncharacterized protein n=1 Tax=Zopfia rhizophila CBS 207.26 TaxID=1314779 RepID=A0A6A6E331_9PEZI|nr:hypothetical protein K469DRAFT_707018 [Zopfia rhizophila CBS 207.26]
MLRTAFISGPLDASEEYFNTHYVPHLQTAIQKGDHFVMGPVAGIDTLSLHYLLSQNVDPKRITVFMAHFEYQNASWRKSYEELGVSVKEVGSLGTTTRDRDAAMTQASDYDILRYRSEEEAKELYGSIWWPRISNTEMNERRRKGVTSQAYNLGGSVAPKLKDSDGKEGKESVSTGKKLLKLLGKR